MLHVRWCSIFMSETLCLTPGSKQLPFIWDQALGCVTKPKPPWPKAVPGWVRGSTHQVGEFMELVLQLEPGLLWAAPWQAAREAEQYFYSNYAMMAGTEPLHPAWHGTSHCAHYKELLLHLHIPQYSPAVFHSHEYFAFQSHSHLCLCLCLL